MKELMMFCCCADQSPSRGVWQPLLRASARARVGVWREDVDDLRLPTHAPHADAADGQRQEADASEKYDA